MGYPHLRPSRAILIAVAILLPVALSGVALADEHGPTKHPKYSSAITQLLDAAQSLPQGVPLTDDKLYTVEPPMDAYMTSGLLRLDALGRLQAYVRVSATSASVASALISAGAIIERQDDSGSLFQVRVPVKSLPQVAELDFVAAVTLPNYGRVNVGSRLTEGDALLDFDDVRSGLGVDGSGVTVGVISDGIFGLADAIASGDLPATSFNRDGGGKLVSTTGGVIAISFRADDDLEGGLGGSATGAEGTAILEIVHDIAPGAQLRFANFSTDLEFNAAVDYLAANSDVVIDDIGFFGFPYDQSSAVSTNTTTELNRASNSIRGYYTSVGNQALGHYQETYVNSGTDGASITGVGGAFHEFAATAATTDCFGLGPRIANVVELSPGSTAFISLIWNDSFGSATTDYDLFVFTNDTGQLAAFSIDDNPGVTGEPVETVAFTNSTAGFRFFDVFIQNFIDASAPKTFDMFVLGGAAMVCSNETDFNYNTLSSSVPAQSDAGGGVVSVGAISASDSGIDDIESFSSRGPTNNGVTKPDVTAIDGVSVTGSGGFPSTFFGTSAAAPHVAGLAALLLEDRPDLLSGESGDDPSADRAALRSAIVGTAVDLGAGEVDNTFGSGRVDGLSAGQVGATPTPTPTSVPSATPTPTLTPTPVSSVTPTPSPTSTPVPSATPSPTPTSVPLVIVTPTPTPVPSATPTPTPVPSSSAWSLMALGVAFGLLLVVVVRRRAVEW